MRSILEKQYGEVRAARQVVFRYLTSVVGDKWKESVTLFDGKTIAYMLLHVANTYKHWMMVFALEQKMLFWEESQFKNLDELIQIYEEVDHNVQHFLAVFEQDYTLSLKNGGQGNIPSLSPLQVFTHVITHEFHHKGQLMTMSRLLGGIPPDTDIIRYL